MGVLYSGTDWFDVYPYIFDGKPTMSDYTVQEDDFAIGVDTSGGEVVITFPDVSSVTRKPRCWVVKKMSSDTNRVILRLANPDDSMYGADFYSMKLEYQGEGIKAIINANDKYTFSDWSGTTDQLSVPSVTTQTPSESGGTLTMNGSVDDLGAETSVYAYFRYRDVTAGSSWTETTKTTVSATGAFSETAAVTTGNTFAVQALVEIIATGVKYYGAVLQTTSDYYDDLNEALNDGLVAYWPLQETTGTDVAGAEAVSSNDITFAGGVTISSDTINSNTIYKRVFGTDDWGQSSFAPQFLSSSYTILIQASNANTSGDHTILNFGRNVLGISSDTADMRMQVNGREYSWGAAQPLSMTNIFITVDLLASRTRLYTVTASAATNRITANRLPGGDAAYTRVARGASGDAYTQDYEYLDNGEVRSLAIWKRVLATSEMVNIVKTLDTDGELIVT